MVTKKGNVVDENVYRVARPFSSSEETSSSHEEMSSQTKHTAENAAQAEQAMDLGRQEMDGGVDAMRQMSSARQI